MKTIEYVSWIKSRRAKKSYTANKEIFVAISYKNQKGLLFTNLS